MAEFTFSCPSCKQLISCDDAWAGHQIQCPLCQQALTVPQKAAEPAHNPLVPKPPSGRGARLSLSGDTSKPVEPQKNIPIRNLAPAKEKKKNPMVIVGQVAAVLVVLGVAAYFGWPMLKKYQDRANQKRRQMEQNSDGGELGHIAELHNVLDATEPGGRMFSGDAAPTGPRQRDTAAPIPVPPGGEAGEAGAANPEAAASAATAQNDALPVVPPAYSLDLQWAKIPQGRVNGTIGGSNFVAQTIRVDPSGTAQVLRFVQGNLLSPDREILVYLHLKPGEKLGGQNLSIAKETRGSGLPQITKLWKTNPKYAPSMKSYSYGYALKLELGTPTNNLVPGKIFLSLPDNEQSVIAGVFSAASSVPEASADATQPTAGVPGVEGLTPEQRAAYEQRYGLRRK